MKRINNSLSICPPKLAAMIALASWLATLAACPGIALAIALTLPIALPLALMAREGL
jgi:hypothetical protein